MPLPYDASGNVLNDGMNQYLYDGEGRICAVASSPVPSMTIMTGYIYDADGTRVAKGSITAWSCDPAVNGFQTTNDYVLGPGGEQVTEMGVGGASSSNAADSTTTSGLAWQHTNVWAGGKLLATYDNDGLHFYFNDPLGTRRAQTDYAGVVEQTCQSLPFGDGESCGPTPTEHLFTGKERDAESGNDYFEARYYSSSMGRFMSPDWSAKEDPVPYADLDDPQSLNLYAYVRNNPLARVDADGHCCESDFDSFQTPEQANYFHQAPDSMDHQFFGALGSFIKTAATFVAPELGVISAIHDAANGNYGSAGLDLAGAIPVGGLAKGAGILENAAQGAAGEAKVAGESSLKERLS